MVEKPYYDATAETEEYSDLADALTEHGAKRAREVERKYGRGPEDRGHTEVHVESWAHGPLLYLTEKSSNGEPRPPTLGKSVIEAIVAAGYVPWGFRPNRNDEDEFMWYLRPIEGAEETIEEIQDTTVYAIEADDGSLYRDQNGDPLTVEDEAEAHELAERLGGLGVREL